MTEAIQFMKYEIPFLILFILHYASGIDVAKVHVTFMNHLDIGFNHGEHPKREDGEIGLPCLVGPYPQECGFSYSVINVYFDWFFPEGLI